MENKTKENFERAVEGLQKSQGDAIIEIIKRVQEGKKILPQTIKAVAGYNFRNLRMTEVAEMLGTSRQMVMDWTNKGCPRSPEGGYSLPEIVSWRLSRAESGGGDADEDLVKERIEKLRLENSIKRGEYLEKNKVIERMIATFQAVSNTIRRAIKMSSPLVVGSTSSLQNEQILTAQYKKALSMLRARAIIEDWTDENENKNGGA